MVTYRMHKKKQTNELYKLNKAGGQNLLSHVTTDLGLC